MPDKIVKKTVFREFGIEAENNIEFIRRMEALVREIGYSQTLMCWAIWLKEANVKTSTWRKSVNNWLIQCGGCHAKG